MSETTGTVHIAPTLQTMARVYALSREGGPKSERFTKYVALTPTHWGLVPYNPMAGDAALDTVNALIAMDAETVAQQTAQTIVTACNFSDDTTLAIAVRSKGLWTDRIATEVDERVAAKPRRLHHGVVSLWSREENAVADVVRESAAETVRIMWHAMHGVTDTVNRVLACEGLAYALAEPLAGLGPFAAVPQPEHLVLVMDALQMLGDSTLTSDIAAVLYGDEVAASMGYAPLGLPDRAGYQEAIVRARKRLRDVGPAAALREHVA